MWCNRSHLSRSFKKGGILDKFMEQRWWFMPPSTASYCTICSQQHRFMKNPYLEKNISFRMPPLKVTMYQINQNTVGVQMEYMASLQLKQHVRSPPTLPLPSPDPQCPMLNLSGLNCVFLAGVYITFLFHVHITNLTIPCSFWYLEPWTHFGRYQESIKV